MHPPSLEAVLGALRGDTRADPVVVSLAPKLTIAELAALLGGFGRVARVIPNAASVVGAGFNPVSFSPSLSPAGRDALVGLLRPLGQAPEVPERDLEAYAVLTAMGPTYLWFQLYELAPPIIDDRRWQRDCRTAAAPTRRARRPGPRRSARRWRIPPGCGS